MNMIRPLIAASAMACASLSWAGAPALVEFGRHVPGYVYSDATSFAIADFDHDGRDDLVVAARSGTSLFQVFGQGATGIVSKQAVFVPDAALEEVLVATVDGLPQVVTVARSGVVRRFAGWPLVEVHSFEIGASSIGAGAIGDIDHDGELELVTSSGSWGGGHLYVNTLLTGEPRWSLAGIGGYDIMLGQFDADPALEIVLASTPGNIIDGATQATDWSYKDGFGGLVASGHFQATGGNQFVAASSTLMAFQSAPWSPVWDLDWARMSAMDVADLDGDGIDDIIGTGQFVRTIDVIDGRTRTVRLSIPYEGYEATSISAWDHDGNGDAGIVFGPDTNSWQLKPPLQFADAGDGTILWQLAGDRLPPYQRLAVGRHAAGYSLVYPFGDDVTNGGWAQLNAVYGTAQWRTPPDEYHEGPFAMEPRDTAYANGGTLLVLAGDSWYTDARFTAVDSVSHTLRWMLDGGSDPRLMDRNVEDVTVLDAGGPSTIAACLNSYEGKRLALIDAVTGTLAWTSVAMGQEWYRCGVIAGRFTEGGNPLVVAVLDTSLRAYDMATHLLAWTLPAAIDGASLIEQGVVGREIAIFKDSQLNFHDAGSRALLRTFDLGMPISAVRQVRGDIHGLLVAAGGHLLVVDGTNGSILLASPYLGFELGKGNRIATVDLGLGYTMVGIGSHDGVFRYRLYTGDGIFTDGFDLSVD